MDRPSLNAPCPCGSGKRFRKCCAENHLIVLPRLFRQAEAKLARHKVREKEFIERYGHLRMPVSAMAGESERYISVGGKILRQETPRDFVTTVHDIGLLFFGDHYLTQQEELPLAERHLPVQWMHSWIEERDRALRETPNDPRSLQLASGAAWLRLAFDIYTIEDNSVLKAAMRKRLMDPKEFQAARYELAVAALWIAAGFDLQYENEKKVDRTHPEFVAIDRFSDARVAVEAKSNHRTGVQGFMSGDPKNTRKANVRKLLEAAYRKKVDLPLYAFLDMNLPRPRSHKERDEWVAEIHQTVEDMTAEGAHVSCPVNIVFFTNDPSHYLVGQTLVDESDVLWMVTHRFPAPRIAHPSLNIRARISKAREQRVAPPDSFWEDE